LLSLHDYNEDVLIKRIEKFQDTSSIALISDAGSPLISDPGYKLVQNYIKKELLITTIPGPTSIISALQLSGLPINNFIFFGFLPKNKKPIEDMVNKIKNLEITSIFFISGIRLISFLKVIFDNNIDRKISVCKEITKKNEHVFRGNALSIISDISKNNKLLKGEFIILISGNENKNLQTLSISIEKQIKKLLEKFALTEVVEIVHKLTNISKKEIYTKALLIKND